MYAFELALVVVGVGDVTFFWGGGARHEQLLHLSQVPFWIRRWSSSLSFGDLFDGHRRSTSPPFVAVPCFPGEYIRGGDHGSQTCGRSDRFA